MSVGDLISDVATQAGVTVVASSNVTPAVTLYDARDAAPSLLDTLGIKPHVVVKTLDGRIIAEYGAASPFDPLLAAALLIVVAACGVMLSSVVLRALR